MNFNEFWLYKTYTKRGNCALADYYSFNNVYYTKYFIYLHKTKNLNRIV